jgi:putative cell wall-binding protein
MIPILLQKNLLQRIPTKYKIYLMQILLARSHKKYFHKKCNKYSTIFKETNTITKTETSKRKKGKKEHKTVIKDMTWFINLPCL